MAIRNEPEIGTTRAMSCASEHATVLREPIRGLHQGLRSNVPLEQAGYMTAPHQNATNSVGNTFQRRGRPYMTVHLIADRIKCTVTVTRVYVN